MGTAPAYSKHNNAVKQRRSAEGDNPNILTEIYSDDVNIAIWKRELPLSLSHAVDNFVRGNRSFQTSMSVTPQSTFDSISEALNVMDQNIELSENIAELVDMFCYLFELKQVGLRMTALDRAMCPKFHVDKVPCRLVTTFCGVATEWLPHNVVDRSKLGLGSKGLTDKQSGLYGDEDDIRQLNSGDVALLKGELWDGNENAGLVHRSPCVLNDKHRLLLTLDFIN